MKKRIELRAMVLRDGKLLAFRDERGALALPGGAFDDDADDIDAAMDSLLRASGVVTANPAEAFLRTDYHRDGETQVVLNLYALTEWEGEPRENDGQRVEWIAPDTHGTARLDEATRASVMVALELAPEPEPSIPADLAGGKTAETAVRPGEGDRRFAGLDVLRTLRATDPFAAFERMSASMPELAGDIVDFALGDVWSGPALDRRTRSLQTVAMLASLGGRGGALRSHIDGALNHGASPEQVVETMRMVAVYAGFPAALEAWPVMEQVFAARGIERPGAEERGR
jgi:4-carboxymuconolactone decarboxylase